MQRGGRILSIAWAPFGKGWFGEQKDRLYEVVYYDRAGDQHMATCKTSLFGGVYFTEDRVAHRKAGWEDHIQEHEAAGEPLIRSVEAEAPQEPSTDEELSRLRAENRRLEDELQRLRNSKA